MLYYRLLSDFSYYIFMGITDDETSIDDSWVKVEDLMSPKHKKAEEELRGHTGKTPLDRSPGIPAGANGANTEKIPLALTDASGVTGVSGVMRLNIGQLYSSIISALRAERGSEKKTGTK